MDVMRIEKGDLEERSYSMDIEQEVIDTYYEALDITGTSSEEAVYIAKDLTGLDVAQIEQILMKSGILESVQEKEDKKKDDEKEVKEEEDKDKDKDKEDKDDEEKVDESIITVEEEFTIPGTDIILEKGDKFKVLNETGEWVGDEEQEAWAEHLDDILKYMGDAYSEFKYIPNPVRGFDNYQGPYGYIQFKGKKYKVWTKDEYEYGPKAIFIEDFPYSNTGPNELDGYIGSAMSIFDEVDMNRKGFNKYGFR